MAAKTAFGTEKRTVMTLGALSVLLTFVLSSLPLVVAPVLFAQ